MSLAVFFFLPHILSHQCKTLEASEEILTRLWGLSPATSVIVMLFTLLCTTNKTQHSIVYSQTSFSSKVQINASKTLYPCFPVDKFCSHKEMDFTANHTKSYINEVKKLPTLCLHWFIPGPDSVDVSKMKHWVHTTHILGTLSSVPTHGGLQHAFFTDTVMFLKLVKNARMTWRKRLWESGGIYSYPINKHFLYVSMSVCSLCSSATPWFRFWSLPTLTKPHAQCHIGHFSHTTSQGRSLSFSKTRWPLSAYFWVSTYTKIWGSTVSPHNLLQYFTVPTLI